jgi:hypothetical protein
MARRGRATGLTSVPAGFTAATFTTTGFATAAAALAGRSISLTPPTANVGHKALA